MALTPQRSQIASASERVAKNRRRCERGGIAHRRQEAYRVMPSKRSPTRLKANPVPHPVEVLRNGRTADSCVLVEIGTAVRAEDASAAIAAVEAILSEGHRHWRLRYPDMPQVADRPIFRRCWSGVRVARVGSDSRTVVRTLWSAPELREFTESRRSASLREPRDTR